MPDLDVTAALGAAIGPDRMQGDPIPEPQQLITGLAEHGYVIVPAEDAEELIELRALFEVQHRRMIEAAARWRSEDPQGRELTMPDLGKLLEWLMRDADRARAAAFWDRNLAADMAGIPDRAAVAAMRERYIEEVLASAPALRQLRQGSADNPSNTA